MKKSELKQLIREELDKANIDSEYIQLQNNFINIKKSLDKQLNSIYPNVESNIPPPTYSPEGEKDGGVELEWVINSDNKYVKVDLYLYPKGHNRNGSNMSEISFHATKFDKFEPTMFKRKGEDVRGKQIAKHIDMGVGMFSTPINDVVGEIMVDINKVYNS